MSKHPAQKLESRHDGKRALAATAAGAAAGAITSVGIGGMGITAAGTGIGLGLLPVAIIGGVVGLAGYGVYRAFRK